MINTFYNLVEKFYEMCAYHVTYTLDENENIVEIEKNTHFGSTKFVYSLTGILVCAFILLMLSVINESVMDVKNQRIFLNHYDVQEICFDNKTWVECISLGDERRISVSLDDNGSVSTLFIKED